MGILKATTVVNYVCNGGIESKKWHFTTLHLSSGDFLHSLPAFPKQELQAVVSTSRRGPKFSSKYTC